MAGLVPPRCITEAAICELTTYNAAMRAASRHVAFRMHSETSRRGIAMISVTILKASRVLGCCALGLLVLITEPANSQPTPTLAPMIERVSPAVVNISVSGRIDISGPLADDPFFRQFFDDRPDQREFQSAGSGVIVDASRGLILTNHHVVENANRITVTLLDNRTADAHVVGSDQASDLAVLEISLPNLREVSFGDSESISVGDYVVAIGNPFGFSHTVTSGIVSGLGRSGINPDRNAYEDFIQTDASINPGNSGGALVDLNGNLIGVNSAILSRGGGNIGIGFAIPVNMARNVMQQLVEFGEVHRGLLGVTINSISPEVAQVYELSDTTGAIVVEIAPGSAAEAAGMKAEDIIVAVNGRAVADSSDLRNQIGLMMPGDAVEVDVIRDGERRTFTAVLGALSRPARRAAVAPRESDDHETVLDGVELSPGEDDGGVRGLVATRIDSDSPAGRGGLREGDFIVRINRQPVMSLDDARAVVDRGRAVVLQVRRDGRDSIVFIP
jgi:Do/DeqQ family serine protease